MANIVVLGTSDSIVAKMDGSAVATNPTWNSAWIDTADDTTSGDKGSLNGSSEVTLVSAPGSGKRQVDFIRIYNEDTDTQIITVQVAHGSNRYTLGKWTLEPGQHADVLGTGSSGSSMTYPAAGIPLSTGSGWGNSIVDHSSYWETAYSWGDHSTAGYLHKSESESVTGVKTFNKDTLLLKGTSSGRTTLSTENTSSNDYTISIKAETGTVALLSDIPVSNGSAPLSGVVWGGEITINNDSTGINVAAGVGVIVDNYTDPENPIYRRVSWPAQNDLIPTDISTNVSREVAIDLNGNVVFSTPLSDFTAQQHREYIIIGWADSIDYETITGCKYEPDVSGDIDNQSRDYWMAMGPFNADGNVYEAYSNDLRIKKSLGHVCDKNTNFANNPKCPHITTNPEENPCTEIYYYYRSAPGVWVNDTPSTDEIDPDHYDTGSGLADVPEGKWTIQVISMYSDPVYNDIQYGQALYDSREIAGASLFKDIVLNPYNEPDIYRAFLIVKGGTTDLSDPDQAEFVHAGRDGLYAIGDLAKSRVSALSDLTDTDIISPSTDQLLRYNGLKWVNASPSSVSAGAGICYFFKEAAQGIPGYETLSIVPDTDTEQDESIVVNNETKDFEKYSTAIAMGRTLIDAGVWVFHIYTYVSIPDDVSTLLLDVYRRADGGTETLLFTVETPDIDNSTVGLVTVQSVQPAYVIEQTDLLVIKIRAKTTHTSNVTIHFVHSGTTNYSYISTPLSTKHNDLAGLQGGTANEFYHLTSAQASVVANTSGTNTGDNATNSQYSGLVTNATHTGDATGSDALTVVKIQGKTIAAPVAGDDGKIVKYDHGTTSFVYVTHDPNATHTGDATGATALSVVKIQGKAIAAPVVGDDGKFVKYDNATSSFVYAALVSNATHTGDATGSTTLSVVKIQGKSIATPVSGDDGKFVKYDHGTTSFVYAALVSNATHTGDATGSDALSVVRIQGKAIAAPVAGDDGKFVKYDNATTSFVYSEIGALTHPQVMARLSIGF